MIRSANRCLSLLFVAAPALVILSVPGTTIGGIDCPCQSTASGPIGVLFACPLGDGDSFGNGLTITVTLRDCANAPIQGIPATDIWVIGCNNLLALCNGSDAISASGPTDANGQTTITGQLAAGGCDLGLRAVVQGVVLDAGVCGVPCIPIKVKSPDISKDLMVNLVDFSLFGGTNGYPSPPKPYNECIDYTAPFGTVTLPDYAKYGSHSGHRC